MKVVLTILLLSVLALAQNPFQSQISSDSPALVPLKSANVWCASTPVIRTGCDPHAVAASLKTAKAVIGKDHTIHYTWTPSPTAANTILLVTFNSDVTVIQNGKQIKPSETGVYDLSYAKGEAIVTEK